jgi:hypothetical protein
MSGVTSIENSCDWATVSYDIKTGVVKVEPTPHPPISIDNEKQANTLFAWCFDWISVDLDIIACVLGRALEITRQHIAKRKPCDHNWINVENEVVSGGRYCSKCGAIGGSGTFEIARD